VQPILRNGGLPTGGDVLRLAVGGFLGLMAWELFARFATPILVGAHSSRRPWSRA
jgi:hypothetical protein